MRAPRPTVRVRLALLFGALFLVAGGALVGLTHLLYRDAISAGPLEVRDRLRAEAEMRLAFGERLPPGGELRELLARDGRTIFRYVADVRAEAADEALAGALREQLVQSALALGATTVVALLLGWIAAGRVLRPLRRITETARASSGSDLRHRVALRGPDDELKELADTLDSLLEALEGAFGSQRAFSQNVSHELRTPLAILRAEAEIRLAEPGAGGEERRFARRVLEAAEQGERTVDRLLALARSESGLLASGELDLAELTGDVVGELAASAGPLDIRLELGEATAWADRALTERLVANLVENAVRHNVPGGWVRVEVGAGEDAAHLRVSNSGPRLPPEEVESLFQPFVRRGDPGFGRPGLGLGLPIVRAVVEAHGGAIDAEPRAGGGLEIRVRLPRRPAP